MLMSLGALGAAEQGEQPGGGIGILPDQKRGLEVDPQERNPFGVVVVEKKEALTRGEAGKLTEILRGLPFSGLSRNGQGEVRSVLLGDLRLVEGEIVPQLVEGQTDELMVQSVSEDEVVVVWSKEAGRQVAEARKLNLPLDGGPKVEVRLPGQRKGAGTAAAARKSVMITPPSRRLDPAKMLPTAGVPESTEQP